MFRPFPPPIQGLSCFEDCSRSPLCTGHGNEANSITTIGGNAAGLGTLVRHNAGRLASVFRLVVGGRIAFSLKV